MIRRENDPTTVTEKAEAAFRDVQRSVIERAKQTNTPVIVFADNQIQSLTPDEYERRLPGPGSQPAEKE